MEDEFMTVHAVARMKKAAEANAQLIENRISFFQREEEKMRRDLEEVKRQASTIEDGRVRMMEKKLADRAIAHAKERAVLENRLRASQAVGARVTSKSVRERAVQQKQNAANGQRKLAMQNLRQKHLDEAQLRLRNSEKAVAIQRARLESKLKENREKEERLRRAREQQDVDKRVFAQDFLELEAKIPMLEEEEMKCLQRLQNSRLATQNVLEELEGTLGSRGSVAALIRAKTTSQDPSVPVHVAPLAPAVAQSRRYLEEPSREP
jgi:hypothetical protein